MLLALLLSALQALSYDLKELHPIQLPSALFCQIWLRLQRYPLFWNQVLGTHPSWLSARCLA
jgi:hypothetical protein